MNRVTGVLGISRHEEALVQALEHLRRRGYQNVSTFSPVPSDKLTEGPEVRTSPVRAYTLTGAILGFLSGLALTLWTVLAWPLITGGKPIVSMPPFLIICFELTILLGGLATLTGLAIHARLRPAVSQGGPGAGYDARFSVDRFGVFVSCEAMQIEEVKQLFIAAGVEETSVETA